MSKSFALAILFFTNSLSADDSRIAPAKPIALQLHDVTASQALNEFVRQTGIPVTNRLNARNERVTLELKNSHFWPALDAIARAAHGRIDLYAQDGKLALVERPGGYVEPLISYSGPFRTALKRITGSRDLETAATTSTATLEVAWEPTLEPLFLETSPRNVTVRDDRGAELPFRAEASALAPVDGRLALAFDIPLPALPRTGLRLGLLKGSLHAIAPSKMADFTFETLTQLNDAAADSPARRRVRDEVTCRINKIQLLPDRWSVQDALDYPPGGVALESHQSRVANNQLDLESSDGSKRWLPDGYVVDLASARKALITYHFLITDKSPNRRPADWTLRYRTPVTLIELPFTFSFKDVPLP
jgi:hypothetical protein